MKGIYLFAIILWCIGCYDKPKEDQKHSDVLWLDSIHTGLVVDTTKGSDTISYRYTNTSNIPLLVSGVHLSCGCTNSIFSTEPLLKGDTAYLKLVFKAKPEEKSFEKNAFVVMNTKKNVYELKFSGKLLNE